MKKYNVFQDGTTPMYRDTDGTLWAMSGHSHMGNLYIFKGTCLDDIEQLYIAQTNFCVGHADYAFNGIRYPEGIRARGSVWPFGLYICPNTHRFFCFFHNETGWAGRGTAYDAHGLCNTPAYDSDFRHIGLMHSDDEGKTWNFDRWVLTGEQVCFTENYNPNGDIAQGQKNGRISLSSGDFSLFVNPNDDYMYLIYNIIHVNTIDRKWEDCHTYIARARKRTDGTMSDFVKYYEGSFCEAGNLGKETPIALNSWHARVVYSEPLKKYIMSSVFCQPGILTSVVTRRMQLRTSDDLVNWSEPIYVMQGDEYFGHHYVAVFPEDKEAPISVLTDNCFSVLKNGNGTDVLRQHIEFANK
jgi:hypothetical protein